MFTVYLQFCQSFGYICELCGEESDIIYPFQLQTVAVCKGLLVYLLNEINFTHTINKCFNSIKLFIHVTIDIASHLETHGHSCSVIMSLLPKFVSFSWIINSKFWLALSHGGRLNEVDFNSINIRYFHNTIFF